MNKFKKFASLLLALVMALALAAPAFAEEDTTNKSITVTNATVDATYKIYKIFDATYTGAIEAEGTTASYTIEDNEASKWYSLVSAQSGEGKIFTLNKIGDSNVYNVSLNEGKGDAVLTWLQELADNGNLPAHDGEKTATSATVEFTGLGSGYFLITSSLTSGEDEDAKALITVTNADPDKEIIDKNQIPSGFEKKITGGTTFTTKDGKEVTEPAEGETAQTGYHAVEIGKPVTYEITYGATNFNGEEKITEYVITDKLPKDMTLTADSLKVYVKDKDNNWQELQTPAYTKGTIENLDTTKYSGDSFTITIPWIKNTGEENKYDEESLYVSPNTIKIEYTATLTADSAIDGDGNKNEASVDYTSVKKDGTPGQPGHDDDHETVYTYALAIKKVDENGKVLPGVKFELTQGDEIVKVSLSSDGYYYVDPDKTGNDTDKLNEVVTNDKGEIVIKGVNGKKYTLTETETLPGYNKLTEAKEITPVLIGSKETHKYWDIDENGVPSEVTTTTNETVKVDLTDLAATSIIVVNTTGTLLPSTGGIGTTIFYIVGGVLAAGAVILLITKRRMNIDKD